MFALAALLAYDPLARGLRIGAVLYAALGVLFMLYFMVLQFRYIQAFCIYCFISAVTTVLLTVTAVWHLKASRSSAKDAQIDRRLAALLALSFVVMLPLQALAQTQPPTAPQSPQWYGHGPWWMWGDGAGWPYWWICEIAREEYEEKKAAILSGGAS
jgi:hypothetical protein